LLVAALLRLPQHAVASCLVAELLLQDVVWCLAAEPHLRLPPHAAASLSHAVAWLLLGVAWFLVDELSSHAGALSLHVVVSW
jgi:hypothetical protein